MQAGTDFVLARKKSRGSKRVSQQLQEQERARERELLDEQARERERDAAGLQFSTTDRRILEELRRKMQARDAQFRVVHGTRHHPFSPDEVPYPRSYDRRVVDKCVVSPLTLIAG